MWVDWHHHCIGYQGFIVDCGKQNSTWSSQKTYLKNVWDQMSLKFDQGVSNGKCYTQCGNFMILLSLRVLGFGGTRSANSAILTLLKSLEFEF